MADNSIDAKKCPPGLLLPPNTHIQAEVTLQLVDKATTFFPLKVETVWREKCEEALDILPRMVDLRLWNRKSDYLPYSPEKIKLRICDDLAKVPEEELACGNPEDDLIKAIKSYEQMKIAFNELRKLLKDKPPK